MTHSSADPSAGEGCCELSLNRQLTWLERQADAAALEVASTALPSLMQSLVSVTAAATASALTRAACTCTSLASLPDSINHMIASFSWVQLQNSGCTLSKAYMAARDGSIAGMNGTEASAHSAHEDGIQAGFSGAEI